MKKPLIISASGTKSDLEHLVLEIFSTVSISKANNSTEVRLQMCIGSTCKCSKKVSIYLYTLTSVWWELKLITSQLLSCFLDK